MRPWTAARWMRYMSCPMGFNGATALRPWTVWLVVRPRPRGQASMGPRPCGRGRPKAAPGSRKGRVASMGPRPCGRGRSTPARSRPAGQGSFNGATALRPWTVYTGKVAGVWISKLQLVGEYCLFFYETTATAHPSYIAKLTKLTKSVNLRGHSSPSGPRRRRSADGWCRRGVPVFPAANRHSLANPMLVSGREGG